MLDLQITAMIRWQIRLVWSRQNTNQDCTKPALYAAEAKQKVTTRKNFRVVEYREMDWDIPVWNNLLYKKGFVFNRIGGMAF